MAENLTFAELYVWCCEAFVQAKEILVSLKNIKGLNKTLRKGTTAKEYPQTATG